MNVSIAAQLYTSDELNEPFDLADMASLALIDNVIDLHEEKDSDDDYEDETEDDIDSAVNMFDMERIISDCLSQTDLSAVWDVMSCHSVYLSSFLRTQHILVHSNSIPIPIHWRHMIAAMASARLSCSYLVHQHSNLLASLPGNRGWEDRGLSGFPVKIQKLYDLNMILAHRPWQITRDHITELTQRGQDSWSLSELVYSIILMCHFHCLSSFIMSCVMMEPDVSSDIMFNAHGCSPGYKDYKVEKLMQKMSALQFRQESPPPQEELQSRFYSIRVSASDTDICDHPHLEPDISRFIRDTHFQYVDFAKRQDEFATFRIQDFTWDEEGYSTIARFDEDTAQCLDDKFRTIYNLTYGTMGSHTSIDTSLFRRASWNYIQCLWGVRHDDYDYHEVNELLHRCNDTNKTAININYKHTILLKHIVMNVQSHYGQ